PSFFQYNQTHNYWSAVGVILGPGEDWKIAVNATTAASPACVATQLASYDGGGGKVNYVIGDFNHNATGTYYPSVTRVAGIYDAWVQWSGDANLLSVNGPSVVSTLTTTDALRVWDVNLVAGTTYTFYFYGGGGNRIQLFGNSIGGTYWVGRSSALV